MDISSAIENLIAHNEPVPKPLRLPTEADIRVAEEELGISFHPDYVRFQLEAGNVCFGLREPFVALPGLMPYLSLAVQAKDAWTAGVPRDCVAICGDNGNYFFLNPDGHVGYFDHDSDSLSISTQTLADWIDEEWINDPALSDE
ncbi:MAG: SMI1/KNR4 family protein [Planctomycetota bacterium]